MQTLSNNSIHNLFRFVVLYILWQQYDMGEEESQVPVKERNSAVVKQFVANGRDLGDAMGAIGQMVGAKEELQKRGEKKKRSVLLEVN